MAGDEIKRTVMEKYGQAALRVAGGERGSCGGTGSCGRDPVSSIRTTAPIKPSDGPFRRCRERSAGSFSPPPH